MNFNLKFNENSKKSEIKKEYFENIHILQKLLTIKFEYIYNSKKIIKYKSYHKQVTIIINTSTLN